MNIDEFNDYLKSLPEQIRDAVPRIVAREAVQYYKDRFREKAWTDAWVAGKPKKGGSLLVQSGALVNSIRASEVSPDRVVISAGNDKVPYARVHNEGSHEIVTVPAHTRIKGGKNKKTVKGGDISTVKSHTRHMNIPQRQFMGINDDLSNKIKEVIDNALDNIL